MLDRVGSGGDLRMHLDVEDACAAVLPGLVGPEGDLRMQVDGGADETRPPK